MNTQEIYHKRIADEAEKLAKRYMSKKLSIIKNNIIFSRINGACMAMGFHVLNNLWISVKEALPDDDENVLLIFDDSHIIVAYHSGNYWWWCDGFVCGTKTNGQPMYSSSQKVNDKPTHWMPIPSLKGGEE